MNFDSNEIVSGLSGGIFNWDEARQISDTLNRDFNALVGKDVFPLYDLGNFSGDTSGNLASFEDTYDAAGNLVVRVLSGGLFNHDDLMREANEVVGGDVFPIIRLGKNKRKYNDKDTSTYITDSNYDPIPEAKPADMILTQDGCKCECGDISTVVLPVHDMSTIVIPVHVHIITNADMVVNGQAIDMWVTRTTVEQAIPDINGIWAQAGIEFDITSSYEEVIPDKQKITAISKSSRKNKDETNWNMLTLVKSHVPGSINVYLFPFIGATRQGVAPNHKKFPHFLTDNESTVFMGVWSNKYSGVLKKVLTGLPMPVENGSLSRTMAHEIGHVLGLNHPRTSDVPRLMGGPISGYHLTTDEIRIARIPRQF